MAKMLCGEKPFGSGHGDGSGYGYGYGEDVS